MKKYIGLALGLLIVILVFRHFSAGTATLNSEAPKAAPDQGANTSGTKATAPNSGAPARALTSDSPSPNNAGGFASIDDLERTFGHKFDLETVPGFKPHRITGKFDRRHYDGLSDTEMAYAIARSVAPILGISHPEQITNQNIRVETKTLGTVAMIDQFVDLSDGQKLQVENGLIRVHIGEDGNAFMVNSSFVDGIPPGMSPDLKVSAQRASEIVRSALTGPIDRISDPVAVAFKFSDGSAAPSWKFVVVQTQLGPKGIANYYVNAYTGTYERVGKSVQ